MKEEQIRPKDIFDEYLNLAEKDVELYFSDVHRDAVRCPACASRGEFSFNKNRFDYAECPKCQTLYVSPRPDSSAFEKYYTESKSAEYWATTFYKHTEKARREKLWKPKAKMVLAALEKFGEIDASVIDIGGGYGIFAEEYEKLTNNAVTIIEPGPSLATACGERGLTVVEKFLEDVIDCDLP